MKLIPSSLRRLMASVLIAALPIGTALAQEVVLGASVQLTGPVANTGRYYRDAYQLAIDKINGAGGAKIAGQSHKLALKLYDKPAFWVKMAALLTVLVFTFVFQLPLARREVSGLAAKALAIVSLALWLTVALAGRWIGFS